jgi:epoxyqueuosine reductase
MNYTEIEFVVKKENLRILGGFHPQLNDGAPLNSKTLILLGPDEPKFWEVFKTSSEYTNNLNNPLDSWSKRTINNIATKLKAQSIFPFGGPPFKPFYQWALRTQRAHESPISLLVHDEAGLFVSYRGALSFDFKVTLPQVAANPCIGCSAPCLTTCPVQAFKKKSYDASGCITHIKTADTKQCISKGCAARRICPISKNFARLPEQSAFHMKAFTK